MKLLHVSIVLCLLPEVLDFLPGRVRCFLVATYVWQPETLVEPRYTRHHF